MEERDAVLENPAANCFNLGIGPLHYTPMELEFDGKSETLKSLVAGV